MFKSMRTGDLRTRLVSVIGLLLIAHSGYGATAATPALGSSMVPVEARSYASTADYRVEVGFDVIQKAFDEAFRQIGPRLNPIGIYRDGEYPVGTVVNGNLKVIYADTLRLSPPIGGSVDVPIQVVTDRQQTVPAYGISDLSLSQSAIQSTNYPGSSSFIKNTWMLMSRQLDGSLKTNVCTFLPGLAITTEPFQRKITTDKTFTWYKTVWKRFFGIPYPDVEAHTENTWFNFSVSSTALQFRHLQFCFLTQIRLSTLPGGVMDVRLLSYYIQPDRLGFASPMVTVSSNNPLYNDFILPILNGLASLTSGLATILGNAALYVGQQSGFTSKVIVDRTLPFIRPHLDDIENTVNSRLNSLRDHYVTQTAALKSKMDDLCAEADFLDPDRLAGLMGSSNEKRFMDFLAGFGSQLTQVSLPIRAGAVVQYRSGVLIVDGRALPTQGGSSRWVQYEGRYYDPAQLLSLLRTLYAQYATRFQAIKSRVCAFAPPQLNGFAALPITKATCNSAYIRLHPVQVSGYSEDGWWRKYSAFDNARNTACHLNANIRITADRCLTPVIECVRRNLNNVLNGMPDSARSCTESFLEGLRQMIQGRGCEGVSAAASS